MHNVPFRRLTLALCIGLAAPAMAAAPPASAPFTAQLDQGTLTLSHGSDRIAIDFVTPNTVHVHAMPQGRSSPVSVVIDPAAKLAALTDVKTSSQGAVTTLSTAQASLRWDAANGRLQLANAAGQVLLSQHDLDALLDGRLLLDHDSSDPLYGIGGYSATEDASVGMLRTDKQKITAGEQGHAGAPLVWSTAGYGVLVNTQGGNFNLADGHIATNGTSRKDLDYYLVVGSPKQILADVAKISGHAPLFPKWAMGFTNSQWGIDEKELLSIVDTYRAKHIPLDNFTLDFDWKAWGKDHYGEFRWNTEKFPDGPSGKLKQMLDQRGIHLTGIMKPRVHLDTVEGRYATAHHFWIASKPASDDYFSHKPVREIDFDLPAARAWFFNDALKHSFATGMVGWWNDEADDSGDDSQFLNMERALYDGQRAVSNQRVWSINRNFWLGAQRYAYGLWSGDIPTGFASMAGQRARMLSAINVGAMQWGMDGGGFKARPSDENYARWIEFGAFTPIFRVHGTFNEKRQPWVYGQLAEKAATDAIRLRYALIPYIYSYQYQRRTNGIGLVRPLLFDWPNDPHVRNDVDAWMFGDSLLVSPVVKQGQQTKRIYLPAGSWIDWFNGTVYRGGQTISYAIDSQHWGDIPLFIREGAIIPTQPPMDYVGEKPLTRLDVEVFPSAERTQFDYYDDDGASYDYEHGSYFSQSLAVQRHGDAVQFETGAAFGSFTPELKFYLLKIHGAAATAVTSNGTGMNAFTSLDALQRGQDEGWATGHDRFGAVSYVRVAAAEARRITLTLAH